MVGKPNDTPIYWNPKSPFQVGCRDATFGGDGGALPWNPLEELGFGFSRYLNLKQIRGFFP